MIHVVCKLAKSSTESLDSTEGFVIKYNGEFVTRFDTHRFGSASTQIPSTASVRLNNYDKVKIYKTEQDAQDAISRCLSRNSLIQKNDFSVVPVSELHAAMSGSKQAQDDYLAARDAARYKKQQEDNARRKQQDAQRAQSLEGLPYQNYRVEFYRTNGSTIATVVKARDEEEARKLARAELGKRYSNFYYVSGDDYYIHWNNYHVEKA